MKFRKMPGEFSRHFIFDQPPGVFFFPYFYKNIFFEDDP